jgi:Tfp pilus assembly protein PilN
VPIEIPELDRLRQLYKDAVERWIAAIREEEALATPDHSIAAWDRWDEAGFRAQEAEQEAKAAREAYKDGLRMVDYNI